MLNEDTRTRAQRWSDVIAEFCGSWSFIFWFSGGIALWMYLNGKWVAFDVYPYILLNLVLTVVSTMQSPVIMMSQNRQVDRDREMVKDLHKKFDEVKEEIRIVHAQLDYLKRSPHDQ
jgi:uncharacterized membrane protein